MPYRPPSEGLMNAMVRSPLRDVASTMDQFFQAQQQAAMQRELGAASASIFRSYGTPMGEKLAGAIEANPQYAAQVIEGLGGGAAILGALDDDRTARAAAAGPSWAPIASEYRPDMSPAEKSAWAARMMQAGADHAEVSAITSAGRAETTKAVRDRWTGTDELITEREEARYPGRYTRLPPQVQLTRDLTAEEESRRLREGSDVLEPFTGVQYPAGGEVERRRSSDAGAALRVARVMQGDLRQLTSLGPVESAAATVHPMLGATEAAVYNQTRYEFVDVLLRMVSGAAVPEHEVETKAQGLPSAHEWALQPERSSARWNRFIRTQLESYAGRISGLNEEQRDAIVEQGMSQLAYQVEAEPTAVPTDIHQQMLDMGYEPVPGDPSRYRPRAR